MVTPISQHNPQDNSRLIRISFLFGRFSEQSWILMLVLYIYALEGDGGIHRQLIGHL